MFWLVSNTIKIGKPPRVVGGKLYIVRYLVKNGLVIFSVLSVLKRKRHVNNLPKMITLILAMSNIYGIF